MDNLPKLLTSFPQVVDNFYYLVWRGGLPIRQGVALCYPLVSYSPRLFSNLATGERLLIVDISTLKNLFRIVIKIAFPLAPIGSRRYLWIVAIQAT